MNPVILGLCWLLEGHAPTDLADAALQGADLRYADLVCVDARGADLQGAELDYADLRFAWFDGADLTEASLEGADLRYVSMRHADLTGATGRVDAAEGLDLTRAYLMDTDAL